MLYRRPTPIGNLGDVTLRASTRFAGPDVIACEDTRRTRALLSALDVPAPQLVVCDEHSEARAPGAVAQRAARGESVVLVSDAGMPGIADPGRALVGAAPRGRRAGRRCCPARARSRPRSSPRASPPTATRSAAGCRAPRPRGERFLAAARGAASRRRVRVAAPRRRRSRRSRRSRPTRAARSRRELTKLYEEVVRGTASEVAGSRGARAARRGRDRGRAPRPGRARRADAAEALAAVAELVAAGSARARRRLVARLTGPPRRALYDARGRRGRRLLCPDAAAR